MGEQIWGFILEGQSCSGKTSLMEAIRARHRRERDGERNTIFLSEQYSQTLNRVHGELRSLSQEENLQVLCRRAAMLEDLSRYADEMGKHSRRSRGLFFVFERFHLNYAYSFPEGLGEEYRLLENRLLALHAQTVLCAVSPEKVPSRLARRASLTGESATPERVGEYIENQKRFVKAAKASRTPVSILNTDEMRWEDYAAGLYDRFRPKE